MSNLKLSEEALANIASQLGKILPNSAIFDDQSLGQNDQNVELKDSLELWVVEANSIKYATSIASIIKKMGRWHHQIFNNNSPIGYATSLLDEDSKSWSINQVSGDVYLANVIDYELTNISKVFTSIPLDVRLMVVPAINIYVLWVVEADKQRFFVLPSQLIKTPIKYLLEQEFLIWLKSIQIVQGMT
jgi:hypothetical protein